MPILRVVAAPPHHEPADCDGDLCAACGCTRCLMLEEEASDG